MAKEIKTVVPYEIPRFIPGDESGKGMHPLNDAAKELMQIHNLETLQHVKDMGRPIQMWYRLNDEKVWEYNHFNWDHNPEVRHPVATHPDNIKAWKNGKWAYRFAFLKLSKVIDHQEMVIITK